MSYAYIAKGALFLVDEQGGILELESEFSQKQLREFEKRKQYSPVQRDEEASPFALSPWMGHSSTARFEGYRFADMVRIDERYLLYTLCTRTVTGLFRYDLVHKSERRLVHSNDFKFDGLDYNGETEQICVGQRHGDGSANIELRDLDGRLLQQLTGGDSVDTAPAYSRKDSNRILFQSQGIARDDEGLFVAVGPASVNFLNVAEGNLEELVAEEGYDFLVPKEGPDGAFYCIRRPEFSAVKVPLHRTLVAALLFPFNFVHALFNFLTVFTELFKNQPTLASGPPAPPLPKNQRMMVLGQAVELGKQKARRNGEDEEVLVPENWELIRVAEGAAPEPIARHVCAFDINPEGHVYYTNGYSVFRWDGARHEKLSRHELVERVQAG